jgi:uncharacterized protein YwgA
MRPEAQDFALAVISRANERAGGINKTKLLKLLYLADIEHYRKHDETLTGFNWRFHLYGPWAAEFDPLLEDLARTDKIELEAWNTDQLVGNRISPKETRELDRIVTDTDEYYRILRVVDTWTDRSLPDLLNYVYFETEPMMEAVSQQTLSFTNVSKDPPKVYRRVSSGTSPKSLARLKAKLRHHQEGSESARTKSRATFRSPRYDDIYLSALGDLGNEEAH